uniref:Candidate secreted effector n=1 Tax=Meloidogyne incognita TaxID=6306 RepID=A0A914N0K8_MELIC
MNSQFSGEQEQEEQTSLGSNAVNNSVQNEENNGGRVEICSIPKIRFTNFVHSPIFPFFYLTRLNF